MSIKKRVAIGLIGIFMGLYLGNLQMAARMGQEACTEVLKERETYGEDKRYKAYDLSEGNVEISTSGQYYITCSTTSSSYRIVVDNAVKDVELILENVNIDVSKKEKFAAIEINGEATLTVLGSNNIVGGNSQTAINITEYGVLTISEASTGTLTVKGGLTSAAIGASAKGRGGSLYINGGIIQAYGQGTSAAIGTAGSLSTLQKKDMKSIVINGGKIYCEAESGGAAIGGGMYSTVKNIKINGGYIVAKAGGGAEGIGSGYGYEKEEGNIEIQKGKMIIYQGNRLSARSYPQPIRLGKKTIIGDEAVIIAIGHIEEIEGESTFKQIDISELDKKLRLSIKPIGLSEQINLEEKEPILNIHLPHGKYIINLQDENHLCKQEEINNKKELEESAESSEEEIEKPEESPKPSEEEIEKPKESSKPSIEEIEKPEESPKPSEEEIEKPEESPEPSEEEVEKPEESPEPSEEEIEKPKESPKPSVEEIEKPKESPKPLVEEIEKPKESPKPSVEEIGKQEESHTDRKNYRVRIYSTSISTRQSWQDISFLRTTPEYYISCGVKLK